MLCAGVSTACLYPRVVEEALYDLALSGVSNVEIFINSHSELRRSFVDTMARLLHRFDMTCASRTRSPVRLSRPCSFPIIHGVRTTIWNTAGIIFPPCSSWAPKVFVLHGNKVPAAIGPQGDVFRTLSPAGRAGRLLRRPGGAGKRGTLYQRIPAVSAGNAGCPGETGEIRPGHQTGGALRRRPSRYAAGTGVSCGTRPYERHGEYGDCLLLGKGRFRISAFLEMLAQVSPDCSVILELYRSGFSDVAELAANYTLLQNRIRSAETARER